MVETFMEILCRMDILKVMPRFLFLLVSTDLAALADTVTRITIETHPVMVAIVPNIIPLIPHVMVVNVTSLVVLSPSAKEMSVSITASSSGGGSTRMLRTILSRRTVSVSSAGLDIVCMNFLEQMDKLVNK
jgi:hypothetical protein